MLLKIFIIIVQVYIKYARRPEAVNSAAPRTPLFTFPLTSADIILYRTLPDLNGIKKKKKYYVAMKWPSTDDSLSHVFCFLFVFCC